MKEYIKRFLGKSKTDKAAWVKEIEILHEEI